jgi:hypothetical protein
VFIKLVVLILVCGSSGIGLLSVRQSRLQAAHEMAEARHRTILLKEQAGEIRAQIAQACTPERVIELISTTDGFKPAIHNPAVFTQMHDHEPVTQTEFDETQLDEFASDHQPADDDEDGWVRDMLDQEHTLILENGTRVILTDIP